MEKKKSEHDLFMEVWKSCEDAERRREWEKKQEELNEAFQNCQKSLSNARQTVNEVCTRYGWPPRKQG